MGMYARLRQVSPNDLSLYVKKPRTFYRDFLARR